MCVCVCEREREGGRLFAPWNPCIHSLTHTHTLCGCLKIRVDVPQRIIVYVCVCECVYVWESGYLRHEIHIHTFFHTHALLCGDLKIHGISMWTYLREVVCVCVRACERENESDRAGICAMNCMHIQPIADGMAQNLEILFKNFQSSTRILKGFVTSAIY